MLNSPLKHDAGIVDGKASLTRVAQVELDPFDVIRLLDSDSRGFKHVGDDGIVRSIAGTGEVIDFAPLSQEQLMVIAASIPGLRSHFEDVWQGVDGHNVKEDQAWSPPPPLLPMFLQNGEDQMLDQHTRQNEIRHRPTCSQLDQDKLICEYLGCKRTSQCRMHGCTECTFLDGLHIGMCDLVTVSRGGVV